MDLDYDKELFSIRLAELYGERPEAEEPKPIGVGAIICASSSVWVAAITFVVGSLVRLH